MAKTVKTLFFTPFNKWITFPIFSLIILGCNDKYEFERMLLSSKGANTFQYKQMTSTFTQERFDNNHTSLDFKILDDEGFDINSLTKGHFRIYENGVQVRNYRLIENSRKVSKDLDIVFALDITASMKSTIDKVKNSISNFVAKLERRNYTANLCVLTFKDHTTKYCNRWVRDNPSTPQNENLNAFIAEISRLKATGGDDPTENSLGALKDVATTTPWHSDTQRITIMFTGNKFWVMPLNRHIREAYHAPTYSEALNALVNHSVTTFVISPKWIAGYAKDYHEYPSVVEATGGLFFDFKKLTKGEITIDGIFNQISNRFSSVYSIDYLSEENPGLNPNLPLHQREIRVEVDSVVYFQDIEYLTKRSNMENGKPSYETEWPLTNDKPIHKNRVHVEINSRPIRNGYSIRNGNIIFDTPPPPGSQIKVTYEYSKLRDNIDKISSIRIAPYVETLTVYLNNKEANSTYYEVIEETDDYWLLKLKNKVFSDSDPFNIRGFKKLDVKVDVES